MSLPQMSASSQTSYRAPEPTKTTAPSAPPKKEGCYIAGQIAGMVNRVQTAAEIIEEIMAQTEQVLKNAANFIK